MNKRISQGQIHQTLRLFILLATRFARELWWKNQEFPSVDIIPHGSLCSYAACRMNSPFGGRSSDT
jgi:hypothetical protein